MSDAETPEADRLLQLRLRAGYAPDPRFYGSDVKGYIAGGKTFKPEDVVVLIDPSVPGPEDEPAERPTYPGITATKQDFERFIGFKLEVWQWEWVKYVAYGGRVEPERLPDPAGVIEAGRRRRERLRGIDIKVKPIVDEIQDFNFNEYSTRDEEGRWWLIGGPNGPVRHPDDPDRRSI
jgi:hypothetical protein